MALKVKDIYSISNDSCKAVNYYTGADYGIITDNNMNVMQMNVERIYFDTDSNVLCIAVS